MEHFALLKDVLQDDEGEPVDPTPLLQYLRQTCEVFAQSDVQNDAHDALLNILDLLGPPPLFLGKVQTAILQEGQKKRFTPEENLTVLTVPITGCETLGECTKKAFQKEQLELEGKRITRWTRLVVPPQYMVVHLNRFDPIDGSLDSRYIEYTEEIVITTKGASFHYSLYYVCGHIGQVGGGHYVSVVKWNDAWYVIDDDTVYKVTETDKVYNLSGAYMLGYELKDPEDCSTDPEEPNSP